MSENEEANKSQDDNLPAYDLDMSDEIYVSDRDRDDRELIYRQCLAGCFLFPFLPFIGIWLAGKWLIERLRK